MRPVSDKPNILIIWGDDIGQTNLSCYSHGVMGYRTPNIDWIAAEGAMFTDYYGEQTCTLLRRAELHRRPCRLHHGPESIPHRPDQGRSARCPVGPAGRGPDHRDRTQG